jgi:hypothetical protein
MSGSPASVLVRQNLIEGIRGKIRLVDRVREKLPRF